MKTPITAATLCVLLATGAVADEYLGYYSANRHNPNSTSNHHGEGLEIYGE